MKTAETGYSRRAFLKLTAAGAAGVGMIGWLRMSRGERIVVCSQCGAEFAGGHHYKAGTVHGIYCPNCGIELSRLTYDLRQEPLLTEAEHTKVRWDCGQVPFPNPKWVRRSDKPAVVLSELKI